jgi:hypothetical protein
MTGAMNHENAHIKEQGIYNQEELNEQKAKETR